MLSFALSITKTSFLKEYQKKSVQNFSLLLHKFHRACFAYAPSEFEGQLRFSFVFR